MTKQVSQKIHWAYRRIVNVIPFSVKAYLNKQLLWYCRNYISLYWQHKTPVVVYQMGKVGSSSIYNALKARGLFVFHNHNLRPEIIAKGIEQWKTRKPTSVVPRPELGKRLWVYNHIIKKRRHAKYITLVRDPLGRNVSAFFSTLDKSIDRQDAHAHFSPEELQKMFLEQLV